MFSRMTDSFNCPECVLELRELPLCFIVAHWGMITGKLLMTENVSREFHIKQKAAKCILHYIEHEGKNHIRSRRFIQHSPLTGRKCALRILDVQLPPDMSAFKRNKLDFRKEELVSAVNRNRKQLSGFEKLRQWMCSRSIGESVPIELLEEE